MRAFAALMLAGMAAAYDRDAVVAYAKKYYNTCNHDCSGAYTSCSPWSYWGSEHCGYSSHGGDCANFVSQCVLAGGHKPLNSGSPCRGYPCGKEEVGARNLGVCLQQVHGWTRTCGKHKAPPSNIAKGDVLVYHETSCSDYSAHAVVVVSTNPVKIACHSTSYYGKDYTYMSSSKPYYEWLHHN